MASDDSTLTAPTPAHGGAARSVLSAVLSQSTLLVLLVLGSVIALLIPEFLTVNNLLNVLRQVSITGIVAVGMTFVIITGGIDISVGSTVALGGVVAVACLTAGWGVALAILAALVVGLGVGMFNGGIIAYARVSPFVTTLGTMYVIRGMTLVVTNGEAFWGLPPQFARIGTGYFLGIPIPVIIMLAIYLAGFVLLRYFVFGRYVLAVGGDEEAARLCGISVKREKMLTYGLCGMLSATAGVILAGRLGSAQPSVGTGYELIAIAATVIGGTSLTGGKGTIIGTLIGTVILGIVSNALNLWGVASFYQTVIIGSIVLVAVLADKLRKKNRE
jgi:ribose transport system permease protein